MYGAGAPVLLPGTRRTLPFARFRTLVDAGGASAVASGAVRKEDNQSGGLGHRRPRSLMLAGTGT
jgi:hypothetical protein